MKSYVMVFTALVALLVSFVPGCESNKVEEEFKKTKAEAEQFKENLSDLEGSMDGLKDRLDNLVAENKSLKDRNQELRGKLKGRGIEVPPLLGTTPQVEGTLSEMIPRAEATPAPTKHLRLHWPLHPNKHRELCSRLKLKYRLRLPQSTRRLGRNWTKLRKPNRSLIEV